jgi:hypothetical protein
MAGTTDLSYTFRLREAAMRVQMSLTSKQHPILIVEDDLGLREKTQLVLEDRGFPTAWVPNCLGR